MKKLLLTIFFTFTFISNIEAAQTFQFQISKYETMRQGGQKLNVYIRYKLKDCLPPTKYPDYRPIRKVALSYLEPTPDLPENVFWEIIAEKMGRSLMKQFPIQGISVQLLVYPNEKGNISEPGFHGPTYTQGNISEQNVTPIPIN